MKNNFVELLEIPSGVNCSFEGRIFKCNKGNVTNERKINAPQIDLKIEGRKVNLIVKKANKKDIAILKSFVAHLKNLFAGLESKFVYELEICNVHFPMTVKLDGKKLIINNFLGEKKNRIAEISKNVDVEIKGNKIIVSGHDLESTGQVAATIEKATRISKRDRRVFQDGIFITKKPGVEE